MYKWQVRDASRKRCRNTTLEGYDAGCTQSVCIFFAVGIYMHEEITLGLLNSTVMIICKCLTYFGFSCNNDGIGKHMAT